MAQISEIKKPYFSHDYTPLEDKNLLKLFIDMGAEGYGLYWLIVEYMHQNSFSVDDEKLLAYRCRCDIEKIHKIMTEYELFRIEDNTYISDRILRNLNYIEQKNDDKRNAANTRWLLSAFNKAYKEFFDIEPVLKPEEIENLKKYAVQIPDLKQKFRDILFTLKGLHFNTDTNFQPCANWLLKDNNLARLVNGEWGKLKHKPTEQEIKAKEKQAEQEQKEQEQNDAEFELKINSISTKADAIAFVAKHTVIKSDKIIISPIVKPLCEKFDINKEELREYNNAKKA